MNTMNGKQVNLDLHNQNVNIAKQISGLESGAEIYDMSGNSITKIAAREKFNDSVDQMNEKLDKHENLLKKYHEELVSDMNQLEICPVYDNILIKQYDTNPFQQIKRDEKSGLIIDTGGLLPEYKAKEDGQQHEEEEIIKVGVVIEAGPDCKYIKNGDVVFYLKNSALPIPFYKLGFYKINEHNVQAVVNSDLTKRFKEND